MSVQRFVGAFFLCFLVTACGLGNLEVLRKFEPRGNAFQNALMKEYRAFAESEEQKHDFVDAQYFAGKALRAAKGHDVPPDKVENWSISGGVKPTLQQARVYLLEVLGPEMTRRVPEDTARVQFLFDCWLEQQEKVDSEDQIPPCREEFYELLDSLYSYKFAHVGGSESNAPSRPSPLKGESAGAHHSEDEYVATGTSSATVKPDVIENPDLTFTVLFDFNSASLGKSAEAKLGDVVRRLKKLDKYEVVISGHTDRAGSKSYNVGLSQRRAEAVKNMLVRAGIASGSISVFGYGELYPQVQTADGVRNHANRRVRVVIRKVGK